jgi:hypothetical protein
MTMLDLIAWALTPAGGPPPIAYPIVLVSVLVSRTLE